MLRIKRIYENGKRLTYFSMYCFTEIYSRKIKYSFKYESCNKMKTLNENGSKNNSLTQITD